MKKVKIFLLCTLAPITIGIWAIVIKTAMNIGIFGGNKSEESVKDGSSIKSSLNVQGAAVPEVSANGVAILIVLVVSIVFIIGIIVYSSKKGA